MYLFLREREKERERARTQVGGGGRGRLRENPGADSFLSTGPTLGLDLTAIRL